MVSENSRNNEEIVRKAADVIELNQRFLVVTYKQKKKTNNFIQKYPRSSSNTKLT